MNKVPVNFINRINFAKGRGRLLFEKNRLKAARFLGNSPGLRSWTKTMDGMFFIRDQQPNTEWVR